MSIMLDASSLSSPSSTSVAPSTSPAIQPVISAGLPWRGLLLALLLSLIWHGAAWLAANGQFKFSFQGLKHEGAAALDTRMIVAAASPRPAPGLSSAAEPASSRKPEPARPERAAPAPASPAVSPPSAAAGATNLNEEAQKSEKETKNERKEGIAVKKSSDSAIENIANTEPSGTPTSAASADAGAASAQSGETSIAPGLSLEFPRNAELEFEGVKVQKGTRTSGSGMLSWRSDGTQYEMSLQSSVLGVSVLEQKSVGKLSPQGLAPERYSDKRISKSEQATHFVRDLGKIQFSNNKPEAILLIGAQDRLSAIVQLAAIIGGDLPRYRVVNRIAMQVAGTDSAEIWEFKLEGLVDISVPAANLQAMKLQRQPRDEFDQRLELWLAPQLGFLPIRIRQSSATNPQEDFTDLVLKRVPIASLPP